MLLCAHQHSCIFKPSSILRVPACSFSDIRTLLRGFRSPARALGSKLKGSTREPVYSSAAFARLTGNLKDEEFEFKVESEFDNATEAKDKQRLDAFLSEKLPDVSRAKLQSGIKEGLVTVNGALQTKSSHRVRWGDNVRCKLPPQQELDAAPEDIPLEIVHEDTHILVLNKAAGMVVHPSPGHYTGTLVNALLHHCRLPAMQVILGNALPHDSLSSTGDQDDSENAELSTGDVVLAALDSNGQWPTIRPGIVHRLDKGTTGLMVVAKDDYSHASLCKQFKEHTVKRTYQALTIGVPKERSGRVETNIMRDPKDRLKMCISGFYSNRGRHAISHFTVLEEVAACRAALVQWRLETGRTHQIRVHAKHMGHPILADGTYTGGATAAAAFVGANNPSRRQLVQQVVKILERPALHAKTLGFLHPVTGERLQFDSELPADFLLALDRLRTMQ